MTLLANSDSRILAMMEAGLAKVIVDDVIVCPSTNFDLIGIRVGCGESGCPHHMHDVLVQLLPHPFLPALLALVELLRNLCIPARTTSPQLLSAGAMSALVTAATSKCRDQNGAAAAAAGCRLLLERASPRTPAAVAFAECFNQVRPFRGDICPPCSSHPNRNASPYPVPASTPISTSSETTRCCATRINPIGVGHGRGQGPSVRACRACARCGVGHTFHRPSGALRSRS
mmetsp:Transcript_4809/g.7857  ORF Transcript_4809/g.7857 Transcript_4809/m.7857 type:complete len:230 (-) Transcript_4809:629-1318(-)